MANNTDECTICRENYNNDARMQSLLPCEHTLCRSCMFDIFKNSASCPFCRKIFKITIQHKNDIDNIAPSKMDMFLREMFEESILIINNKICKISYGKTILGALISIALIINFF